MLGSRIGSGRTTAALLLLSLGCGEEFGTGGERVEVPAPEAANESALPLGTGPPMRPAATPASPSGAAPPLRVDPAPEAQGAGTLAVRAEACSLDGPALVGDDPFRTLSAPAWAPDGSLYVIDAEGRVRHYVEAPSLDAPDVPEAAAPAEESPCALALDVGFGDGGRLRVGEGLGRRPEWLAVDAVGHLYVSASLGGTTRLTAGHVDYVCPTTGRVSVTSDGRQGVALYGSGPAQRVAFGDASCTLSPFAPVEAEARLVAVTLLGDDRVLVASQHEVTSPIRARLHSLDGAPLGPPFGRTDDDLEADDHLCYMHGAIPCAGGLCVLDANCRALRAFPTDGGPATRVALDRLVGLPYPWIAGLTDVRDGLAFLTASQERGVRSDVFDGFVFRVRGL